MFHSLFFFFSSRRRHTRCLSDWSSDVCSSDLIPGWKPGLGQHDSKENRVRFSVAPAEPTLRGWEPRRRQGDCPSRADPDEIGRASCRERVEISVVGGSVKKKK